MAVTITMYSRMGVKLILVLFVLGVVDSRFDHVRLSQNVYDVPDLSEICTGYNIDGVSEKCVKQLDVVCSNTSTTLLATILDASSKFPFPGLGFASKMDYGNYDQCLTVDHNYDGGRILGKYCLVGLVIPDINDNMSNVETFFRLSMCRPDACEASDFGAIAASIIADFPAQLFQDIYCQTAESYSTLAPESIAVIAIFGFFIGLMILSTVYDVYIHQTGQKHHHPLLISFSALSNGRKLLHISHHSSSKEHVEPFNGLRVISMAWIVAGHGFVAWQSVAVTDRNTVDNWLDNLYALYISTSPLAVDTFFYMSGFLLAFQYLKSKKKLVPQLISVPQMYIHRYLRLTPALLMLFLFSITFFQNIGDGPLWPMAEGLGTTCRKRWWPFFLYIQNYYNYDDFCLTQTWYLSADMQMFLLSPLLLIPLSVILSEKSFFSRAMVGMLVLNVLFTFIPMATKFIFPDYQNEYDTHSRLIDYCVGMMLGVFMRETIDKPFLYLVKERSRYLFNLIIWAVILLGLLALIFSYQLVEMKDDTATRNVFASLMRPAWCIGLSWITYSCYHGYGGFVNWLLCRPIYQILGRLTYCIYLVHGSVIAYYLLITRTSWHFSDYNAFYIFCGHYVISVAVAIFWTLAFESPLIIIEKFLMGGGKRPVHSKTAPYSEGVNTQIAQPQFRKSGNHNGFNEEVPPSDIEGGMYKRNNQVY